MTIDRIKQYRALKHEINILKQEICNMESKMNTVSDTVQSAAEFPYSLHTVTISGLSTNAQQDIISQKMRLERMTAKAEKELQDITEWIATIEDSDIRGMILMRYVQGKSWVAIAHHYDYSSESVPRMTIERFFKKN